jgi:hypothetical protein
MLPNTKKKEPLGCAFQNNKTFPMSLAFFQHLSLEVQRVKESINQSRHKTPNYTKKTLKYDVSRNLFLGSWNERQKQRNNLVG